MPRSLQLIGAIAGEPFGSCVRGQAFIAGIKMFEHLRNRECVPVELHRQGFDVVVLFRGHADISKWVCR